MWNPFYMLVENILSYIFSTIYWKKKKNVGADKIKDIQYSSTFQIDAPHR